MSQPDVSPPLWDRLEHRLPAVVDRTLETYVADSPRYQGEVPEHLYRHMAHTCREFGRLYVRAVRQRREPREAELRLFRDRGRARGAEGLPVADFVAAYFQMAESLWAELSRIAGDEPPPEAAGTLLRCLRRVMHEAVHAHQQEFQAAHSEEREAVRATVRALAAGEPATELAARFDIRLADAYGILALRFAPHPSESRGDAVGRRLASRRKLHRLTEELRAALGEAMLAALDPDGGLALLPSAPDQAARDLAAARAAVSRLQRTGIDVTAGFAHAAALADIPSAVRRARRLLDLVGAPGEVAVLDDHLFEYQVSHDTDATPALRSIARRLRRDPELMTTLSTYFACDLNRRETARQLHVHPNTIDNRLSRIASLSGANPRTARGLLLLGAAVGVVGHQEALE